MIKKIQTLSRIVKENNMKMKHIYQLLVTEQIDRLKKELRYQDSKNLISFGYKMYSQNDEDGIIREIFHRIGTTNKVFVELGIGNGLENNTLALLFDGWTGLWIEASDQAVKIIKSNLQRILGSGRLKVVQLFITKKNINEFISANLKHKEIDLLSIDIDGNDFHVLDSITCVSPRVIVIEYNAKFVPPVIYCMEYDATHRWSQDDCVGSSLKFLEMQLALKGYCLVGCNLTGVDAFFVRRDIVGDKFSEPFSAEKHYEPARYYLTFGYSSGHPASYKTLEKSLEYVLHNTE
jgi:hypothetical protein